MESGRHRRQAVADVVPADQRRPHLDLFAAVLHDEYLAFGETIAAVNDTATLERIGRSSEAMRRGALLLPEDLLVE